MFNAYKFNTKTPISEAALLLISPQFSTFRPFYHKKEIDSMLSQIASYLLWPSYKLSPNFSIYLEHSAKSTAKTIITVVVKLTMQF